MNVLFSFKQVQTLLTILVMMIFLIFGCFIGPILLPY